MFLKKTSDHVRNRKLFQDFAVGRSLENARWYTLKQSLFHRHKDCVNSLLHAACFRLSKVFCFASCFLPCMAGGPMNFGFSNPCSKNIDAGVDDIAVQGLQRAVSISNDGW